VNYDLGVYELGM